MRERGRGQREEREESEAIMKDLKEVRISHREGEGKEIKEKETKFTKGNENFTLRARGKVNRRCFGGPFFT